MRVVVRIGGSVVASPLNSSLIREYVDLLKDLKRQGYYVVAVVGGGTRARESINVGSELKLKDNQLDWIAIDASREIAKWFKRGLGRDGVFVRSLRKAEFYLKRGKIVVMGGLRPGMTTDTVAALVGERIKANLLVKGSNVNGIYTRDPKKFPHARKFNKLRFDDLGELFEAKTHKVGINQVIDPEAIKVLRRSRLRTIVVNGNNVNNVFSAVKGKRVGTVIE